jgi:hypothetical protein
MNVFLKCFLCLQIVFTIENIAQEGTLIAYILYFFDNFNP